jgi:hypothetical protein
LWHIYTLLSNDREISNYKTAITRPRHLNRNRKTVFSVRAVPRSYKHGQSVRSVKPLEFPIIMSCSCEKLVVEFGDSSGTQRKENVCRSKPLPSNDNEDVNVNTSVCVTVNCKV